MKIAIIGAGGQARIVYEILSYDRNMEVVAFVDNTRRSGKENFKGVPIVGDHSILPELIKNGVRGAIVAVSMNDIRKAHFNELQNLGFELINAIHPTASIANTVKLGSGVTISIGAIISTGVNIANNVIINTGAIVDHESIIEDHVHISSGCSLAGRVTVKKSSLVGIGSAVRENTTIGENVTVGPGSVVLEDIPDNVSVAGAPAKIVKE